MIEGDRLICSTINETCYIKSNFLKEENLPLLNFSFIVQVPENVTSLKFEHSEIGEIPKIIFERFTNLQKLDLKLCSLKRLRKTTLESAQNLTEIDFSYNKLKKLDGGVFNSTQKLLVLSLFRNEIVDVYESAFTGLKMLEKLVLASNEIRRLKTNVFRTMSNLMELSLTKNRIEDLGLTFQNLTKLEILELNFNKIKQLNRTTFLNMIELAILDLSNNRIDNVEKYVFKTNYNLKAVNLANNRLVNLKLFFYSETFRILDISSNDLTIFNVTSGLRYHSVTAAINAKDNKIENFIVDDNLKVSQLNLAKNNMTSIKALSQCCYNLTTLDISSNPFVVNDVEEYHLLGKFVQHLTAINISSSSTSAVDTVLDIFPDMPHLKYLDISRNDLNGLDWSLLPQLSHLETLNVRNCKLTQMTGLTTAFVSLKQINLHENTLSCDDLNEQGTFKDIKCQS